MPRWESDSLSESEKSLILFLVVMFIISVVVISSYGRKSEATKTDKAAMNLQMQLHACQNDNQVMKGVMSRIVYAIEKVDEVNKDMSNRLTHANSVSDCTIKTCLKLYEDKQCAKN